MKVKLFFDLYNNESDLDEFVKGLPKEKIFKILQSANNSGSGTTITIFYEE